MWGAYSCMGAYKRDVVVVIKMAPIFIGAYFVWVLIVQFLRYVFHIIFINIIIFTDLPTARRVVEETGSSSRRG